MFKSFSFFNVFIRSGFLTVSPFFETHNTTYDIIYNINTVFSHLPQPNGHNTVLTGNIYSFCLCFHCTSIVCFTFVVSSIISVNVSEFQYVPMCALIIADLDPGNSRHRIPSCSQLKVYATPSSAMFEEATTLTTDAGSKINFRIDLNVHI